MQSDIVRLKAARRSSQYLSRRKGHMDTEPESITQLRVRLYREAMGYEKPQSASKESDADKPPNDTPSTAQDETDKT